jgi:5-methyltetrahydropteroyltriglutamate--homocysteine methyltransferase
MIEDLKGKLYSTVVGSFPHRMDRSLVKNSDWKSVDSIRETSMKALRFQLDCGIEFPSDGQFFDMVEMYIGPLKSSGFLKEDRSIGKEDPPKTHPSLELEKMLEKNARKSGALGLRVPITGPFTLAYRVKSGGKNLVEAGDVSGVERLGEAIAAYCKGFDGSLKNSILSVDEPVLPFVLATFGEDLIRKVLNNIFGSIKRNYTCMHVCGEIRSIKDLALSLDVNILDHEFQGINNSKVYGRVELERHSKLLSYGLLNTNPRQVFSKEGNVLLESLDGIKTILENACKSYGLENLLLSPDCGFGGWKHVKMPDDEKWRIIMGKLSNMVRARNDLLDNFELA